MTDYNPKPQAKPLKDILAKSFEASFGITREEAWDKGICVQCRQPAAPRCYSEGGRREYKLSAMCERCFDDMFKEEE